MVATEGPLLACARRWPVAPIAMMLAAGAVSAGDQAPVPAASTLSERATVELVLIEAYVTDGHGRPIRDLTADNFTLSVDGHQRPIHSGECREGPSGTQPLPPEGPQGAGSAAHRREPASLPRRFVLFFEDGTSGTEGLTEARKATQRFLDGGLLPTDEVALSSFDRRLRVLHDFTTNRAALVQAIQDTLNDTRRFSDYASEQAQWDREIRELTSMSKGSDSIGQRVLMTATNYADEFTPRSRDVLRALSTLVDSLASYPGYKAIVFMGDGIAENPAADFMQRFASGVSVSLGRVRKYDLSLEIGLLAHAAAAAGVTLHSLQTSGLVSTTGVEMHAAGRRSNALETLALNTGGTRSTSNDLLKGLAAAEEAGRSYYVIGYVPEGPPDGRYHTVQIHLRHSGGSVRWRRGFIRLLPEQARQRAIEAAYLLPELYTDLGLEISAVPGPAGGTARVFDLVLHVPPGRAVFVPQQGGSIARLESGFVALDESSHETARAAREARIKLTDASAQNRLGIDFYSRIRVPLAAQTITAVVSDRTAGTFGAARVTLPPVSMTGTPGAFGLSIYSMTEKSLWVEIPVGGKTAADEAAADYTIGPSLKNRFSLGERLACGFRLEGPLAPAGLRLLIRQGEREIRSIAASPAAPAASGRTAPPGSITVDLPLEGLQEGDYQLVVRRRDSAGAERDAGMIPLTLRGPHDKTGT